MIFFKSVGQVESSLVLYYSFVVGQAFVET